MPAAVLGLIGVGLGAFLSAFFTRLNDRRARRDGLEGSRGLVVGELSIVETKLRAAIEAGRWWVGDIPVQAWKENGPALTAGGLSRQNYRRLNSVYGALAALNDEHGRVGESAGFPSGFVHGALEAVEEAKGLVVADSLSPDPPGVISSASS